MYSQLASLCDRGWQVTDHSQSTWCLLDHVIRAEPSWMPVRRSMPQWENLSLSES